MVDQIISKQNPIPSPYAESRQQLFRSFEAKSLRSRSLLTQIADDLTAFCGSTGFMLFHVFLFISWITINVNLVAAIPAFDPFPFGLLTMIVSLEAIFLSIFVLVSQNRSSYISTVRDEVHMRVNLIAEEEITKTLKILSEIRTKLNIKEADPELDRMLQRTNTSHIERSVEEQLNRANQPIFGKLTREFKKPLEAVHQLANETELEIKKINNDHPINQH